MGGKKPDLGVRQPRWVFILRGPAHAPAKATRGAADGATIKECGEVGNLSGIDSVKRAQAWRQRCRRRSQPSRVHAVVAPMMAAFCSVLSAPGMSIACGKNIVTEIIIGQIHVCQITEVHNYLNRPRGISQITSVGNQLIVLRALMRVAHPARSCLTALEWPGSMAVSMDAFGSTIMA